MPSGILGRAELLLQAKNYSGSGAWLDESGNGHHAQLGSISGADTNDPEWLPWDGANYILIPAAAGNNLTVTLANTTIYDYTITYEDDTTDTGTVTSDGSGVCEIGDGDAKFSGLKVKTVDVYPDGGGTTLALFDASLAVEPFATVVDSLAKTWTINRSGSGLYVVDRPSWGLYTDDYFEIADHAGLDIGSGVSFTEIGVVRVNDTTRRAILNKGDVSASEYQLLRIDTDETLDFIQGAASSRVALDGAISERVTYAITGRRDVTDSFTIFTDGVEGTPVATSSADLSNADPLYIGARLNGTPENFLDGEIIAVALFREALTDDEVAKAGEALSGGVGNLMLLLGVG